MSLSIPKLAQNSVEPMDLDPETKPSVRSEPT